MKALLGTKRLRIGDYDIDVEYQGHVENDGIGSYEFWGQMGFDKGQDCIVIDEIEPVFVDESGDEQRAITSELNHKWDKYADEIAEAIRDEAEI